MNQNKKCPSCKTEIDKDAKKCPHCQTDLRSWINRHPIITFLLIIFIGIPILAGVFSGNSSDTKQSDPAKIAVSPEVLEKSKQELEVLKKKFDFNNDEFKKVGWYVHKDQKSYTRDMLKMNIMNDGYYYMESQYHASDWMFHQKVQVKIGDKVYESETVPTTSKNNITDATGEGIYENVSYLAGGDNGIIEAIAKSGDQEILVRFEGRESVHDFTLNPKDKQAIIDGYRLSELLKITGGK